MAAFSYRTASLMGDLAPEQVIGGAVTAKFLDVLKVQPFLGRRWTDAEDLRVCLVGWYVLSRETLGTVNRRVCCSAT